MERISSAPGRDVEGASASTVGEEMWGRMSLASGRDMEQDVIGIRVSTICGGDVGQGAWSRVPLASGGDVEQGVVGINCGWRPGAGIVILS